MAQRAAPFGIGSGVIMTESGGGVVKWEAPTVEGRLRTRRIRPGH